MGKLDLRDIIIRDSTSEMWWMEICGRIYMSHGKCSWKHKSNLLKSFKQSSTWILMGREKYNELIESGDIKFHKISMTQNGILNE